MSTREHRSSRRLGAVHFTCARPTATAPRRPNRWPLLILETAVIAIVAMIAHNLVTM
jgi:hypothetical protein